VADAINQGRRAAFVVFTGGAKTDGSRPIWSAATEERVKSLKQPMVLPSELRDLADELGWEAISPLDAGLSEVELVALDVRGNTVVASYEIEGRDLNPVEIAGRGPLLVSVALVYSHPSRESRAARLIDRTFSPATISRTPLLKNLGRDRGYWCVSDFTYTGTLRDYYDSLILKKSRTAAKEQDPDNPEQVTSDLLQAAQELGSEEAVGKQLLDEAAWVQRASADQTTRFVSTLRSER